MIVRLPIQEGMRVKKGDVLAELEDTDYRADYEHCVAALESCKQRLLELERGFRPEEISQAKAELDESEAQMVQLKSERERARELITRKAISQQDLEVADSNYWAMFRRVERLRFALKLMHDGPRVERIDNARAEVRQAEADVAKAKWRLDNCTIRAPISGTILKKNAEEGNIVNTIAFNGSYSLCEMADLSDLEVNLSIQERDVCPGLQKSKLQSPRRGVSGTDVRGASVAADADRRSRQRGGAGPRETDRPAGGRRRLFETRDGRERVLSCRRGGQAGRRIGGGSAEGGQEEADGAVNRLDFTQAGHPVVSAV